MLKSSFAGNVYRIPVEEAEKIWAYLDHREKDGYTMRTVDVFGIGDHGEEIVVEKDVSCRFVHGLAKGSSARRFCCSSSIGLVAHISFLSFLISQCKVYVGETDNPSFGGGLPMLELAERIASSVGPSGPNKVRRDCVAQFYSIFSDSMNL